MICKIYAHLICRCAANVLKYFEVIRFACIFVP